MGKVFEEADQLDDLLLLDDLQPGKAYFPTFVNGNDHAASGDGKTNGGPRTDQQDSQPGRKQFEF